MYRVQGRGVWYSVQRHLAWIGVGEVKVVGRANNKTIEDGNPEGRKEQLPK